MKTTIIKSVLTSLVLAASFKAAAQEAPSQELGMDPPPYSVLAQNQVSNGRSVWVTMYNMFASVREYKCVRDGAEELFSGYYPPLTYYIRAEVKENADCSGGTLQDFTSEVQPTRGQYAKILTYNDGGVERYMWRITLGANSPRPVPQQMNEEPTEQLQQDVPNGVIEAHNGLRNGKSVWVTIYNSFESIRDKACVPAGQRVGFDGYYDYGFYYWVRFEVKENADCSGATIFDGRQGIRDLAGMKGARIMNVTEDGQEKYIMAKYE